MTPWQAILLGVSAIFSTSILFIPAITTHHALNDSWLSAVLATLAGFLLAEIQVRLQSYYPGQHLLSILRQTWGKPGWLIGFGYAFWFFHVTIEVFQEFTTILVAVFMPETPKMIFFLTILVPILYCLNLGIQTLARTAEIFLPVSFIFFVILALLAIPNYQFGNLLPFLDRGFLPVLKGAVTPASWFAEIVCLSFLIYHGNQQTQRRGRKIGYGIIAICGFLFTINVIGIVSIFGPLYVRKLVFPTLSGARVISLFNFLERLESLFLSFWILTVFVKLAIWYWLTCFAIKDIFNLKSREVTIGLLLLPLMVASNYFLYDNISQLVAFLGGIWPVYTLLTFGFVIPFCLLLWLAGRKLLFPLLIFLLLFNSGCWSIKELNRRAVALGLAIDPGPGNTLRLTAEVIKPEQSAGEVAPTQRRILVSSSGETIFAAARNLSLSVSRELYWGHVIAVLINEDLARENPGKLLDFFTRYPEIRENVWLFVTKGSAARFLTARPQFETSMAQQIGFLATTSGGYSLRLYQFINQWIDPEITPVLGLLELKGQNPVFGGLAVFDNSRLKGFLSVNEMRAYMWLINEIKNGAITIDLGSNKKLTVQIRLAECSKELVKSRPLTFKLKIRLKANLAEQQTYLNLADPKVYKKVEKLLARDLTIRLNSTINKFKHWQVDPVGLGKTFHRQQHHLWHQYEKNWPDLIASSQILIQVNANLESVGLTSQSFTREETR